MRGTKNRNSVAGQYGNLEFHLNFSSKVPDELEAKCVKRKQKREGCKALP
jgi:hypothetical protein